MKAKWISGTSCVRAWIPFLITSWRLSPSPQRVVLTWVLENSNISMRNKSSFNTMLKRCLLHEPFLGPQDCSSLSHVQVSWGHSETHLKLEFFVSWAGSFSKPWASIHKGCILIPVCISKSAQHGELHRTVTYQWLSELNVIKPDSASSTFYLLAWKDGKEKKKLSQVRHIHGYKIHSRCKGCMVYLSQDFIYKMTSIYRYTRCWNTERN